MTPHRSGPWFRRWALRTAVELLLIALMTCALPGIAVADGIEFRAPLSRRPTVVRGYSAPDERWTTEHRGVDLAASQGMAVLAAGAGTVRFAGSVAGRPVVSIAHADGLLTTYEPVRASVRVGDAIRRGAVIGTIDGAHPGCPVVACLHWGARRGTGHQAVYLNPLALLGAVRVRLKPVTPADAPDGAPHVVAPR